MKSFRYLLAPVLLVALSGACAEGSPVDEELPGAAASAGTGPGDGAAGMAGAKDSGTAGASADAAAGAAGSSGNAGNPGTGGAAGMSSGGSAGAGGLVINQGGSAGSAGANTGGAAGAAGASTGGAAGSAGSAGSAGMGGSAGSAGGSAGSAGMAGSAGSAGAVNTGGAAGAAGANTGGAAGAGGVVSTGGSAGEAGSAGAGGSPCVPPVSGTCDTLPQCGCLPSENCDVYTVAGETACVAAGQVPPYHNCANFGECQVGTSCVSGVCKPYCDTAADCPGADRACDQVYAGQAPIPSFRVCTQQCDPRYPQLNTGGFSACGPNTLCIATPSGSSDCIGPAGTGVQNTSCTNDNECKPGYTCVGVDVNDSRCLRWCTNDNDCPGVLYCYSLDTPLFVGTTEYGICF